MNLKEVLTVSELKVCGEVLTILISSFKVLVSIILKLHVSIFL